MPTHQGNSNGKLLLPQLNRLHEAFKRRQVSPSVSSISQDQQAQQAPKTVIPTQRRVTEQLTKHWAPFKALRQRYAGTRFEEQRQLHRPQKHKATVQDSALRVEMLNLEEQADNAKAREPLHIAAQRKIAAYQQQYADNQNISFLPAMRPVWMSPLITH